MRAPYPNAPVYSSTSESDGTYKFENIEPGYYNLIGSTAGYASSAYHASLANASGDVITLRPGQQLANIDVTLTPLGVITGKVIDQDGDPVANAWVSVLLFIWSRGVLRSSIQNGAVTNDLGQFRIVNVHPGKYYLLVQRVGSATLITAAAGKPEIRPVRMYYPSALTLDEATPFTIKNGQQLKEMDIRLQTAATYHIRGIVSDAIQQSAIGNLRVALGVRDEQAPLSSTGTVTKDHTFDLSASRLGPTRSALFLQTGGCSYLRTGRGSWPRRSQRCTACPLANYNSGTDND